MGQKWEKNYHKISKNGPNDPKFGQKVYINGFNWIPKFWNFLPYISRFFAKKTNFFRWRGKNFLKKDLKNFKNWPIFAQKTAIFSICAYNFRYPDVRRKVYAFLGKWSNWPNFWYKCTLGYILKPWDLIFLIIWVFAILWGLMCAKRGNFCHFLAIFSKNSPSWRISAPIKWQKLKL